MAVCDGKITIPAQPCSVSFNPAPILANNKLTIEQGETIILDSGNLSATHKDNIDSNLTFIISNIKGGRFELLNEPTVAITRFTQDEIQKRLVKFVQNGSPTIPSYHVAVSDGLITISSQPSAITFNAEPILTKNLLTITEAEGHILTSDDLSATDDHTPANELVFTATNVTHGHFEDLNLPGTSLTFFEQKKIRGGSLRFVTDGGSDSPQYDISVSDGSLSTTPSAAIVKFSSAIPSPSNNTVRNAIVGGSVSGAVGLGFFALRYAITHSTENSLQSLLNRSSTAATGDLRKFYHIIIEPLAKQIFSKIKTTGILGYRGEQDTLDYIAAIENMVIALGREGINLCPKEEHEKLRIINELAKQTKKILIPPRSCLSTAYCCSFFQQDVAPAQMEEKADAIAKAAYAALNGGVPGLAVQSRTSHSGYVELQEVDTELFDSKEDHGLTQRVVMIEKNVGQIQNELRKVVVHLEIGDSKRGDRKLP